MFRKILCTILVIALAAAFAACSKEPQKPAEFDGEAAFSRLLSEVNYAGELEDASAYAEYMFGELPEGTEVKLFTAVSGALADCAIMFKVTDVANIAAVRTALDEYLSSRTREAELYSPEEATKLGKAVIVENGNYLIACVTDDTAAAESILK